MEIGEGGLCGVNDFSTFKFPSRGVGRTEILFSFCLRKGVMWNYWRKCKIFEPLEEEPCDHLQTYVHSFSKRLTNN